MSEGSVHKVRSKECLSSIAEEHGLFWETIWKHPENESLREERENHNQLHPGDEIFIPDKRQADQSCATGQKHSFKRKGVPVVFKMRLMENDEPAADEAYELHIDSKKHEGKTDAEGYIEHPIPAGASKGQLIVPALHIDCELALGGLDPIETVEGVQARLCNLGFDCGEIDGEAGDKTELAVLAFQRKYELDVTGEIDDETRSKLNEVHGN